MRIYTGRSHLLEPAMIQALRASLWDGADTRIVVVPKQLTLQTERLLLRALELRGSFQLQVLSPERLCGRIFEAAGQPEGVRVDERGRVMLVRAAIHSVDGRLSLYRGAAGRRGFADRCARQLELIRQAGLSPERLLACADEAEGMLAMKLTDLAIILEAYEALIEDRFQDGESEFRFAAEEASAADFLRGADVFFYGFDLTPPTLHQLMAAVGAVCGQTGVFMPLENDENARDFDAFLPMRACLDRLWLAAKRAGCPVERVNVETLPGVEAPPQRPELAHLSRELFAFPARPWERAPGRVQLAVLRNPMEESLFAAALCRRLAMSRGWRWSDMLILCRDVEGYQQCLREAFRAYGVPLFLSSSRAASRHPLSECLISALRMLEGNPRMEDALSLARCGCMPLDADEADRLANHCEKYGLRPLSLLRPLKRGLEAELQEIEPIRERFARPVLRLRDRVRRADSLRAQLEALFTFLEEIEAADRLQRHLNALIEADLRQQAGEESQAWNRIIGALDQMAGLMGEAPLPVTELRQTLAESLEAAVIKPLPQSDDAVYAQTTDRIVPRGVKALLIIGEADRPGAEQDGLLNAPQLQAFSRIAHAYLGSDDAELSRMRRFYLKSAVGMAGEYLCVTSPMSGLDGAAQRPGMLIDLVRGVFPALSSRGGAREDEAIQWMLRASPQAAVTRAAQAFSRREPLPACDAAALAGVRLLSGDDPSLARALERVRQALNRSGSAARLNPETARRLYGGVRRQSVTRLESFARCPFAYFTQYGLRPLRVEPYRLDPKDEGSFFHEAVNEFLRASRADLKTLDDDGAGRRMDAISEAMLDRLAGEGPLGDSAVSLAEKRRLKATARACAVALAGQMRGSRFEPSGLEVDFGREDGPARLVVDSATGSCVLEGRIDRLDDWREGGYLRVIDFKRGGKALELDAVYHGLSLQLPVYLAAATRRTGLQSAGVYYFPLDEGILPMETTDPNAVEAERRRRFRMLGLSIDDVSLLEAQSPNFTDVISVSVKEDGTLRKDSAVTDAAGFRLLMERALSRAGEHLDRIRRGFADAAPACHRQSNPCEYCDARAICLRDEGLDGGTERLFETLRASEALKRLKLEGAAGPER